MKPLVNSVTLPLSPEVVFDYFCDLKNELQWNADGIVSAEQLTEGPVREGTRMACQWKGGPMMECTYGMFDRPRRWQCSAVGKGMDIDFVGEVEPVEGGSRLTATMTLLPKGFFRILGPFIRRSFQKEEKKNMDKVRKAAENLG